LASHFGDEKAQAIAALWRRYVSFKLNAHIISKIISNNVLLLQISA
jgi:hypothetical protein